MKHGELLSFFYFAKIASPYFILFFLGGREYRSLNFKFASQNKCCVIKYYILYFYMKNCCIKVENCFNRYGNISSVFYRTKFSKWTSRSKFQPLHTHWNLYRYMMYSILKYIYGTSRADDKQRRRSFQNKPRAI